MTLYKKLHVNATTNLQSLLYLCRLVSGCVNQRRKFPCDNKTLWVKNSMRDILCPMLTWGKSEKSIYACLHHTRTKIIQAPGRPLLLMLHQPTTLEAYTCLTKKYCSYKIAHSSIPSHRTFFTTLECGMRVLYIVTSSNLSWRYSHNTIQCFVRTGTII